MLTTSFGLSAPKHLNTSFFLEMMNYIDTLSEIASKFIRDEIDASCDSDSDDSNHTTPSYQSLSSTLSGSTDNEQTILDTQYFKKHLIHYISSGLPILKSIGLAYLQSQNLNSDNEYFYSISDFITKFQVENSLTPISRVITDLATFSSDQDELQVLTQTEIERFLGIIHHSDDTATHLNIGFIELLGLMIIAKSFDSSAFTAAYLIKREITKTSDSRSVSGIAFEDIITLFQGSNLRNDSNVKKIIKFGQKQKAFLPLLESHLFKEDKVEKTLLFPISVGYGDFENIEKTHSTLEHLKSLTFNGQFIFFISDTWHLYTYQAQAMFSRILLESDPLAPLDLGTAQYDLTATNEGTNWLSHHESTIEELNKVRHEKIFECENDNNSDITTDDLAQENNRTSILRCSFFDVATNHLSDNSHTLSANDNLSDTYPSLAVLESPSINEDNVQKIRAFQLAYFIFLYGKLLYLNELVSDGSASKVCDHLNKLLFPTHLLSQAELKTYSLSLKSHLGQHSHYRDLAENHSFSSFSSGAKKVFKYITTSSTKMLTKNINKSISDSILRDSEKLFKFYTAQQASCKYSIYTMSMVIYFSFKYDLVNQCYPGQINGWWDELIKINLALSDQKLGSVLLKGKSISPVSSTTSTPERRKSDPSYLIPSPEDPPVALSTSL